MEPDNRLKSAVWHGAGLSTRPIQPGTSPWAVLHLKMYYI